MYPSHVNVLTTVYPRPVPPYRSKILYIPLQVYRNGPTRDIEIPFTQPHRPNFRSKTTERLIMPLVDEMNWYLVHGENKIRSRVDWDNIPEILEQGKKGPQWPDKACAFTSKSGFNLIQYAHIIPVSENWVPGQGLWLRVNGILSSNFLEAEAYKLRLENIIPLYQTLGIPMELHRRGTIILLTLSEACKVVKVAEEHLREWAEKPHNDTEFSTWKSSSLMKRWDRKMKSAVHVRNIVGHTAANLYECTLYVIHSDQKRIPENMDKYFEDLIAQQNSISYERLVSGDPDREYKASETWKWKPRTEGSKLLKILPHEVAVNRTLKGHFQGDDLPMAEDDPKMLVPCEIIGATLVFTSMVKKMLAKEFVGWEPTENLRKLMEVLDWLLLLAESPYAGWMYEKQGDRPNFSELAPHDLEMEALPVLKAKAPNPTRRLSHFDLSLFNTSHSNELRRRRDHGKGGNNGKQKGTSPYQNAPSDLFPSVPQESNATTGQYQTGGPGGNVADIDVKAWEDPAVRDWARTAFKGWCSRRHEDILPLDSDWTSDSEYDSEEESDGSTSDETYCKHKECCAVLDAIQDESFAALAEEAKIFHGWMQNDGLGEGLRKLRCEPPQEELFEKLKARDDVVVKVMATCHCDCAAGLKELGMDEGFIRLGRCERPEESIDGLRVVISTHVQVYDGERLLQ